MCRLVSLSSSQLNCVKPYHLTTAKVLLDLTEPCTTDKDLDNPFKRYATFAS